MPLFGLSKKSSQEIIKSLKESLSVFEKEDSQKKIDKAIEDANKQINHIKSLLSDQETSSEQIFLLIQDSFEQDVVYQIIKNLGKFEFEVKKDISHIFSQFLNRYFGSKMPVVEYIHSNYKIMEILLNGYENQEISLNCGVMLRSCFTKEPLASDALNNGVVFRLVKLIEHPSFDLSSDAFNTFKDLLFKHKNLTSEYIQKNYDKFFECFEQLINSENYVNRRQSLKLLGELLLDRHNYSTMTQYISYTKNLKIIMNLLKNESKNIQFEAFHVFKIFVANPKKNKEVAEILFKNKQRLVEYLTSFHNDRAESDEQFVDEREYVIKNIRDLLNPL